MGKKKATRKCSICLHTGHNRTTCPANVQSITTVEHVETGARGCSLCGSAGHYRTTCPSLINLVADKDQSSQWDTEIEVDELVRIESITTLNCNNGNNVPQCSDTGISADIDTEIEVDELIRIESIRTLNCNDGNNVPQCSDTGITSDIDNAPVSEISVDTLDSVEVGAPVNNANVLRCACCLRVSVQEYQLNLNPIPADFVKRLFGFCTNRIRVTDTVCDLCLRYISRENKSPSWAEAWPAVLCSCLLRRNMVIEAMQFVRFMPKQFKEMWHTVVDRMTPSIRALWNLEPLFLDGTKKLADFKAIIHSYRLGPLQNLLNETPVPQVLCPMGCHVWLDSKMGDELALLPACHYLTKVCRNFKSFSASSKEMIGFRPDWPTSYKILNKWDVSPTLLVDNKLGLCIIMCSKKVHSDGNLRYVHVPRHPVLGDWCPTHPDCTAPVTANPKFVRAGRTNKMNSSYAVLKQQGTGGVSTFTLSPHIHDEISYYPSKVELSAIALTLTNRPEIAACLSNVSYFKKNDVIESIQCGQDTGLMPSDLEIKKAVSSGTYISLRDAMYLFKLYNERFQGIECERNVSLKGVHENSINVVHCGDEHGQKPFSVPLVHTAENGHRGQVIYLCLQVLLHNRSLHNKFIKNVTIRTLRVFEDVNKLVKRVSLGRNDFKVTQSALAVETALLQAILEHHPNFNENRNIERATAYILEYLCGITVVNMNPNTAIGDVLNQQDNMEVLVIDATNADDDIQWPETCNFRQLMFCAKSELQRVRGNVTNVPTLSYRWEPYTKWFVVENAIERSVESIDERPWKLLVYEFSHANSLISREEYLNMSGGQSKIRCAIHPDCFFMKEYSNCNIICSHDSCNKSIRWRCSAGFASIQCANGLCLNHGKELLKKVENTFVDPRCIERFPNRQRRHVEVDQAEESIVHENQDSLEIIENIEIDNIEDILSGQDQDFSNSLPYTCSVMPSFANCIGNASGHYLLKGHLNCHSRVIASRKPPICLQKLIHHIHSICPDQSLPLLYPEGLLFPNIFYKAVEGCVVGALPSVMFSEYGNVKRPGSLATLTDHIRIRLVDLQLLTSKHIGYICFLFDVKFHHCLKINSLHVVMRKGLEHVNKLTVLQTEDRENNLKFDEFDSRGNVNRLAAMMSEQRWTYFLTLTCNESETFGVAPIRQQVKELYNIESKEFHDCLQNNCSLILRAWQRTIQYTFDYLVNSHEKPLGTIKSYWYRFEFQSAGALGNVPHVHAGITLASETLDTKKDLSRIANHVNHLFTEIHRTDRESLLEDGIVKDMYEFRHLYGLATKILNHNCGLSNSRCLKRNRNGDLVCRVPSHPPSFTARFHPFEDLYDDETVERLKLLGLTKNVPGKTTVIDELVGGRWTYPTDNSCKFVPSNGRLFSVFRSNVNILLCDSRFSVSYLCKYAAGIDEKRDVVFTKEDGQTHRINVETKDLYNTKITGSRIAEQEHRQGTKSNEPLARELSHTEQLWFLLELPYVDTNVEFVYISTQAPEFRQGVQKFSKGKFSSKVINEDGSLKPVCARQNLPEWRKFSPNQQIVISEGAFGEYFIDKTSAFSVRPPELMMFNTLKIYYKYFISGNCKKYVVHENLQDSPWIDGRCKQIKIRRYYIFDVRNHLYNCSVTRDCRLAQVSAEMLILVDELINELDSEEKSDFYKQFVDDNAQKPIVVCFSSILPVQFDKFIVHLMLSMGRFDTEIDVYNQVSKVKALEHVGLIRDASCVNEIDALLLTRKYILEQLQFLPIGAKAFSKNVAIVLDNLKRLFTGCAPENQAMPLVTLRSIKILADVKLFLAETMLLNNLVDSLVGQGIIHRDKGIMLKNRQPLLYDRTLVQIPGQSRESYEEQVATLNLLENSVDKFLNPACTSVKLPLVIGSPGVGKTYLLLLTCVYALSKGLRTVITSVTSERARALGGEHVHLLFGLPVTKSSLETPNLIAEKCLYNLAKNPVKQALLLRLDCIIFEEIGLLPVNYLVVLDYVLRKLRDHPSPFGGILLIASGDPRQLPPVEGSSIWQSTLVIWTFQIIQMQCFVRSANDKDLQEVIDRIRKPILSADDVSIVLEIVKNRCSPFFVQNWQAVPDNVLRVVGKRAAEKELEEQFLLSKINTGRVEYATYKCNDYVEASNGNWIVADKKVSQRLNHLLTESEQLLLYVGAVMRITFNNTVAKAYMPRFSQGQLCVVTHLPNVNNNSGLQKVVGRLLPPGVRELDVLRIPDSWPELRLDCRKTNPVVVGNDLTKAYRYQYPLKHYVCSTIHKVLGETCNVLATQISSQNSKYALWQREQLLVVLSRVRSLDNIIFVGQISDTFQAIKELLLMNNPSDERINMLMNRLNVLNTVDTEDNVINGIFVQLEGEIPSTNCGFVYMVVSGKFPQKYEIGVTDCIRKKLCQLNSSATTSDLVACRPWILLAIAFGFPGGIRDQENIQARNEFHFYWAEYEYDDRFNTESALQAGHEALRFYKNLHPSHQIQLIQCCKLTDSWQSLHSDQDSIGIDVIIESGRTEDLIVPHPAAFVQISDLETQNKESSSTSRNVTSSVSNVYQDLQGDIGEEDALRQAMLYSRKNPELPIYNREELLTRVSTGTVAGSSGNGLVSTHIYSNYSSDED